MKPQRPSAQRPSNTVSSPRKAVKGRSGASTSLACLFALPLNLLPGPLLLLPFGHLACWSLVSPKA